MACESSVLLSQGDRVVLVRELYATMNRSLMDYIAEANERHAVIRRLLQHHLHIDEQAYILNAQCIISSALQAALVDAIRRLQRNEPIQYILERAYFLDYPLKVTPDVLIPRPETESMVHFLEYFMVPHPESILDIGTGSGCIAIALKKIFPHATVDALDVSQKALDIAQHNAQALSAPVNSMLIDIFYDPLPNCKWSLIVSNPPYIPWSEKPTMMANVVDYEPHEALFVNDHDPLIFYKRIMDIATLHLHSHGKICFEIHPRFSQAIASLLHEAKTFQDISIHQDINDKDRWITAMLTN